MAGAMRKVGVYLGLVEDDYDDYDEGSPDTRGGATRYEPAAVSQPVETQSRPVRPVREEDSRVAQLSEHRRLAEVRSVPESVRITTLHPRTYNEARTIGEHFRDGTPVIMNLSEMDDSDAKRLVDFSAGLVFAVHGTIERVTSKVFLLSPPNVSVAAEDKQRIAEGGFFNQS
ncbi:MAG: SepF, FtsZ-interacting protein related to cell division [uncultured Nocardioidaceae bacterium]|uniref:Cell division protein SepF n=1 Tax=uncultured Nocardioidaceae bacterium TaxID=253824 RepID=A0A6J4KZ06_9ACTN|nr:MAG: SepF, FtsZ-interacting protein related to cell division [uncultured Nocardioidaceae bacterium]